jgi:hypothetical protein
MKTVKHNLNFVTEFDETDPTAKRFLALSEKEAETLLNEMLVSLFKIDELVNTVNEGNSWAKLKLIK